MAEIPDPPVVALLTDMGMKDWYVGTMKGVVLSRCGQARLVDLCHDVEHQSVQEGAFILRIGFTFFPRGTIFLCVVDPEVGTERHPLVARSEDYFFVAPNNGLLTHAQSISQEWECRIIQNPVFRLAEESQTFHGRDVFAPAAGALAAGIPFEEAGEVLAPMAQLPPLENVRQQTGHVSGRIVYVDTYGNLITNITPGMLPPNRPYDDLRLNLRGHLIQGISPHFAAVPLNHPLMYWGSSGFLEIAINYGSAARKWKAHVGEWFDIE